MKTPIIIIAVFLSLSPVTLANAQCTMRSGGQHKHGSTKEPSRTERSEATPTKGYAFINDDGMQEATVTIKDGYQSGTLVVKKGIPLKLNFDLQEESCTGTVVIKDFDIE